MGLAFTLYYNEATSHKDRILNDIVATRRSDCKIIVTLCLQIDTYGVYACCTQGSVRPAQANCGRHRQPHNLWKGEIKLFMRKLPAQILLCMTMLAIWTLVLTAAQTSAQPLGISLTRDPAPPLSVLNDGNGTVNFFWNISYATQINQNYTLEIIPPSPGVPFTLGSFAGAPSPIINQASWTVPAGTPAGCYYARLSFFSNWCLENPNAFEDRAEVGFLVSPAARLRICKFLDTNGNGIWDAGEPPLPGWQFIIQMVGSTQTITACTGADGCTEFLTLPVNPTGSTPYQITEIVQPGWVKTAPEGSTNPIIVNLVPGQNCDIDFGNWQPVMITGRKLLDQAPWPWTSPQWVGAEGQTNPPIWEPAPGSLQPNQEFIGGVRVSLYGGPNGDILLGTTTTAMNGIYSFGPIQFEPKFVIQEEVMPNEPAPFIVEGLPDNIGNTITQWPGSFVNTVSESPYSFEPETFTTPNRIVMSLFEPIPMFADNNFFNRQPSRIWGVICPEAVQLGLISIGVQKDGQIWPAGSAVASGETGLFIVPTLTAEPEGIRPGTYTLTPPPLPDPKTQEWVATRFSEVNGIVVKSTIIIPSGGSLNIVVGNGEDIRVDFCIQASANRRQCNLPVTLTQESWKALSDPNSTIIPGGILYNRFSHAFATNKLVVGGLKTITFEGTTAGLSRLSTFLPQTGVAGKLDRDYLNPWNTTSSGALGGEMVALALNIAYNDAKQMPRTAGYKIENFILTSGIFKGKTVGQVFAIGNAVLGGDPPSKYGLPTPASAGYAALVEIIHSINANYEFVDWNTFNDRGYLQIVGSPL